MTDPVDQLLAAITDEHAARQRKNQAARAALAAGWSLRDLAAKTGVTHQTIANWANE